MRATLVIRGAARLSNSSHLPPSIAKLFPNPVTLPVGRVMLPVKLPSTGSPPPYEDNRVGGPLRRPAKRDNHLRMEVHQ